VGKLGLYFGKDVMRGFVIYESAYGNTELVACTISKNLEKYGTMTVLHAPDARSKDIYDSDIIIIGSPTQLHKASPTINEWLDGLAWDALKNYPVATFDTRYQMPAWRSGSAAQLIAKRIQKLGAVLLVDPESFFVTRKEGNLLPGELERVSEWVDNLYRKYLEFRSSKR
jgi:flavodoxin